MLSLPVSSQRPCDALAREIGLEALHVEGPVAGGVADVDAVLRVDRRDHRVAHRSARCSLSASCANTSMSIGTPAVLHQRGRGGEFAVVQRDVEIDLRQDAQQQAAAAPPRRCRSTARSTRALPA